MSMDIADINAEYFRSIRVISQLKNGYEVEMRDGKKIKSGTAEGLSLKIKRHLKGKGEDSNG